MRWVHRSNEPDRPMPVAPLTAVIITKNEADNITRCIHSLLSVVEEILVVDSGSEDDTVAIARKLGARVVSTEWKGYAQTKNYANSLAANDWILSIDADEVISTELAAAILNLSFDGNMAYAFNRLNNFLGQWIKHCGWFPDWKIRIFDRRMSYWVGEFVHEKLKFSSTVKVTKLSGLLYHYSYKNDADHWQRIELYSNLSAAELYANGKKPSWIKQKGGPLFRLFRTFILQKGFLDGKAGWIISQRAAKTVALKYEKLNQLYQNKNA